MRVCHCSLYVVVYTRNGNHDVREWKSNKHKVSGEGAARMKKARIHRKNDEKRPTHFKCTMLVFVLFECIVRHHEHDDRLSAPFVKRSNGTANNNKIQYIDLAVCVYVAHVKLM